MDQRGAAAEHRAGAPQQRVGGRAGRDDRAGADPGHPVRARPPPGHGGDRRRLAGAHVDQAAGGPGPSRPARPDAGQHLLRLDLPRHLVLPAGAAQPRPRQHDHLHAHPARAAGRRAAGHPDRGDAGLHDPGRLHGGHRLPPGGPGPREGTHVLGEVGGMTDVVIVGGGIAGASAACRLSAGGLEVVLLEKQRAYHDLVRGEWLAPWGIREAQRLGVYDCFGAGGAWEIREWMTWDEAVGDDEVEAVDMTGFIPGVGGPMSFPHHAVCELMAAQAVGSRRPSGDGRLPHPRHRRAGTRRHLPDPRGRARDPPEDGARRDRPGLHRRAADRRHHAQLHAPLGRRHDGRGHGLLAGRRAGHGHRGRRDVHGLPAGYGRARLYLNFPAENKLRYRGEGGVERFLAAFELDCLPDRGKAVTEAVPAGPLSVWPSVSSVPEGPPLAEGVVLIGDEAGNADTVLGTGLSCAMRDSRTVCDLLLGAARLVADDVRPVRAGARVPAGAARVRRRHRQPAARGVRRGGGGAPPSRPPVDGEELRRPGHGPAEHGGPRRCARIRIQRVLRGTVVQETA